MKLNSFKGLYRRVYVTNCSELNNSGSMCVSAGGEQRADEPAGSFSRAAAAAAR